MPPAPGLKLDGSIAILRSPDNDYRGTYVRCTPADGQSLNCFSNYFSVSTLTEHDIFCIGVVNLSCITTSIHAVIAESRHIELVLFLFILLLITESVVNAVTNYSVQTAERRGGAVSYTHLTLPTIYSV